MLEKWKAIKRWLVEALAKALGEAPGAYFLAALWGMLALAAWIIIAPIFLSFGKAASAVMGDGPVLGGDVTLAIFNALITWLLPLALLATLGHQRLTQPGPATRHAWRAGLMLALALIAYLAPTNLLFLPQLLGLSVPEQVEHLALGAWPLVIFAAILGLVLTRRPNPPIGLKLIVLGMVAGALMSMVLAYPVYGLMFNTFEIGITYIGLAFNVVAFFSGFVAVLIWLAVGPLAVLWIKPHSQLGRGVVGATAGALTGVIVLGLVGVPLGGVWAQAPVYGFVLSRAGYESGEWILKLALAVLNVFPITLGLTGLCLIGGGLAGGLTGLFTPRRARTVPAADRAEVLYEIVVALGMFLILTLTGIAAAAIMEVLPLTLQNYFDAYGLVPYWPTAWLQPASAIQFMLALMAFQIVGLVAIPHSYRPLAARGSRATASLQMALYVIAFISVGFHLALYALLPTLYKNPVILALAVIALGLSVEMWLSMRRARQAAPPPETPPAEAPPTFQWTGAGMVVGLLTSVLTFQFVGIALSLVLVSIIFIEPLANGGAPPGVAWLEQTVLDPLFITGPAVFAMWVLWSMGSGFSTSASSSRLSARINIAFIGPRLAALQRRLPRLFVEVVVVASAAFIAWRTREAQTVVIMSLLAALVILHRRWERPPWAIAGLSFIIVLLGVAGLALGGVFTDARPARLMYLLLGPAGILALRALTAHAPENQHPRIRLTAFVGLALVVGGLAYFNQTQTLRQGGISRYDGQKWEAFDATNSSLGVGLNYGLYQDSRGRLWFGNGAIAIAHDAQADAWQRYLLRTISDDPTVALRDPSSSAPSQFVEDSLGRIWVASGKTFGQLDATLTTAGDDVREPGMFVEGPTIPLLADCHQGLARLWDTQGNLVSVFLDSGGQSIKSFDVSSDGTRLVTTNQSKSAQVWDTYSGQIIIQLEGHSGTVNSAFFSPDGARIVTASGDRTARIWDASTGDLLMTFNNPFQVNLAVFNPAGTQLVATSEIIPTGTDIGMQLWDVQTGALVTSMENSREVQWVSFSSDGTRLVSESAAGFARLWEVSTGRLIAKLDGYGAKFNPDGTRIVTAKEDGTAKLWDGLTGELLITLTGHATFVSSVEFSPDGNSLMTASLDTIRLWDAETYQLLAMFSQPDEVSWSGFSPDGTQILMTTRVNIAKVWDVNTGQLVATLLPNDNLRIISAGFTPDGRIIEIGCIGQGGYQTLSLNSPVTDMALDNHGRLWLATAGDGLYRLEGDRSPADAKWEHFSTATVGNLPADFFHTLHTDQAGNLWAATSKGLSIFNGIGWGRPLAPTALSQSAEVLFIEDNTGQLWAGALGGLYQWNGEAWTQASDWPEALDVTALVEDKAGGLWAGTTDGTLHFDGAQWNEVVPDVVVTALAEDPSGKLWVGAQSGLFRFDPATGQTDAFTSDNSGLVTNAVQDLLVDTDGDVWASTFTVEQTPGSPWLGLAAAVLFFGYLSVQTYRHYDRAPESRARRMNRQIEESPDSLYPTAYALLANTPDAVHILTQLAAHRDKADDAVSAEAIRAIVALTTEPRVNLAANLNRSVAALGAEADAARAGTLLSLHQLLSKCLAARLIADLTNLELSVDPGAEGSVALRARDVTVASLPAFARGGMAEAWRALEKVGTVLHKYQEVDTAADRLSFLAEALSAVEAAVTAAQAVKPPEGRVMAAIAAQWRAIVDYEINLISGRAELRLELRTRQARRAEQITVALRLQNVGRATAENVTITLQPGEGFTLDGDSNVTLDRLPSGRSQPVEFTIGPAQAESARIACRVTWDDRMGAGNALDFADVLRFYEVTEAFKRIPNPYIVGHPVKSPEMFQGRADVFDFIRDNLSGPTQNRTIVLHGQRRTGKTSILYQLVLGKLGAGFLPVLIDMQEVALLINRTADFLNEVAYQLTRAIRKAGLTLEPPEEATFAAAPTRTFSRFLDTVEDTLGERKAVLIFDEFELIEGKIAEGKLEADLLNYFRSLIQHRQRLVFIFTGTHRLEEMSHDYWSILFNLALYRRVSFLTPAEAAKLIRQPVAGTLDIDALAVEKIIALTRGHAYFTQLICWALVNHCNANERNYATLNDVNDALQEILASGEAHFAYIWQQADPTERLALAAVAHTIRPGKDWARPAEILETLAENGGQMTQSTLVDILDQLTRQDVLESASDGALRYRFQIEVLRLWLEATKSVTALVERGK